MPIALFIPLQIHAANTYDFDASITALLPELLLAALVIAAVLSLLLAVARGTWHSRLVVAMTGLAIVIWVQGQILVWNYGVLDGSVPDWSGFRFAAVTDTLVWVLIALVAVVFRKQLFRLALPVATVLIMIQALPVALHTNDRQPMPGFHQYNFDESQKFSFSRQDNVIVLLLDAYQSDVFQEILLNEPQIKEEFQGFTYFQNALAGYAKTYPTVALMLTGRWYENKIPIQEFIKQSFSKRSLPAELREQGWRVDLFPHVKRIVHVSPKLASNIRPAFDCATIRSESGQLLDLGFFRASPHWLKSFWLNDYDWRFAGLLPMFCRRHTESAAEQASDSPHAAVRFVEDSETLIDIKIAEPVFKFYHLMIPHAPFSLAEDLEITQLPRGPEGFVRQSRSALEVTRRFIDSLKDAGVYERAMILVLSDHGGGEYIDRVKTELVETEASSIRFGTGRIPEKHLASGLPLVLIKRPGENGDLKVSDSPVSLGDIASTIAAQLNLAASYPGQDIYALKPDAKRLRRYRFFEFGGWRSEYLPEMVEYEVDGFSWNSDNWQPTGRVLAAPEHSQTSSVVEVPAGEPIGFKPASRYTGILTQGWSEPTKNGLVWSEKATARIELSVLGDLGPEPVARFDISPYLARGTLDSAHIEVTVNEVHSTNWLVKGRGWQTVDLPREIADQGRLVFDFEFPDAGAPIDHGHSLDRRMLGMALYRMQIAVDREGYR